MNENPTFRDSKEAKITAHILGELGPEEASELTAEMAKHPELGAARASLEATVAVLRGLKANTTMGSRDSGEALELPNEKRQRLLAAFRVSRPAAFADRWKRWRIAPTQEWLKVAAMITALLALSASLFQSYRWASQSPLGSPELVAGNPGVVLWDVAPESEAKTSPSLENLVRENIPATTRSIRGRGASLPSGQAGGSVPSWNFLPQASTEDFYKSPASAAPMLASPGATKGLDVADGENAPVLGPVVSLSRNLRAATSAPAKVSSDAPVSAPLTLVPPAPAQAAPRPVLQALERKVPQPAMDPRMMARYGLVPRPPSGEADKDRTLGRNPGAVSRVAELNESLQEREMVDQLSDLKADGSRNTDKAEVFAFTGDELAADRSDAAGAKTEQESRGNDARVPSVSDGFALAQAGSASRENPDELRRQEVRGAARLTELGLAAKEKALSEEGLGKKLALEGQTGLNRDLKEGGSPRSIVAVQPEKSPATDPFSTFSLHVSDVSFKLAQASLRDGALPDPASIRSEEFINAMDYRDPEPRSGQPLGFVWEQARYPFAHHRDALRFSVKTAAAGRTAAQPLNLVLLLDNSGSMERADRVRIRRECLRVLVEQLRPIDRISVLAFARTTRLVADALPGDQAGGLPASFAELVPEGGTNLEEALKQGYRQARARFNPQGGNRVVLLTDGAANLGEANPEALRQMVEHHRRGGVALDCFGIGWDGLDDAFLEALSRNGDGRYGFVNSPEAAATEFAAQLAGALRVAASDVKVQVEFNPRRVRTYRQVGYARHQLTKDQFRDNTVDAAELAAAESGNAIYLVETDPQGEGLLATVRARFKVPGTSDYREQSWPVPYRGPAPALDKASPSLRLALAASAFSEWLAQSPFAAEVNLEFLTRTVDALKPSFPYDQRPQELQQMIQQALSIQGSKP
ncbi:MAG: DUF3520 domain-containing protein [Verrucomicrobia bacterium]|nr:DUF3520 domain-containing protein [Verrucomicrobiota bacterium]